MSQVYVPFFIKAEPIKRLILVRTDEDKEGTYVCFEPQVHSSPDGSEALLIIAYRRDDYVDVYHQPSLHPKLEDFTTVGKGARAIKEVPLQDAFFYVNEYGVQLDVKFVDLYEREVHIQILERNPRDPIGMNLLAPIGNSVVDPHEMMMVFMEDFSYVRKSMSEVSIRIGGELHKTVPFPMPIGGQKRLGYGYSRKSFIAQLFPDFEGVLPSIELVESTGLYGETEYVVQPNQGFQKVIVPIHNKHLTLSFSPAFPILEEIKPNSSCAGTWRVGLDEASGEIAGDYNCHHNGEQIEVVMKPSGGWKPAKAINIWLRITLFMVKAFKAWTKTYKWTAMITPQTDGSFRMKSSWSRVGEK